LPISKKIYLENEDLEIKSMSGITLLEISRQAVESLKKVLSEAAPLIFFGMHDEDESIQKVFREVWEDTTRGLANGIRVYLNEILDLLLKGIESQLWNTRKQAALAISTIVVTLDKDSGSKVDLLKNSEHLLLKLSDALTGRTWKGKEAVLKAFCDVVIASKPIFRSQDTSIPQATMDIQTISDIFLREAAKKDTDYKRKSVEILGTFVAAYDVNAFERAFPIILEIIDKQRALKFSPPQFTKEETPEEGEKEQEQEKDAMEVEHQNQEEKEKEKEKAKKEEEEDEPGAKPKNLLVMAAAFRCLGNAWPKSATPSRRLFEEVIDIFQTKLPATVWNAQVAIFDGFENLFLNIKASKSSEVYLDKSNITKLLDLTFQTLSTAKYPAVRASSLKFVRALLLAIKDTPLWTGEIQNQIKVGINASLTDTLGETADYANQIKLYLNL